jgi:DNA polymerase I
LRSLIKPPTGHGIAYIDWAQQEFGIAAALSDDRAMQAAYQSRDPYLAFAKQAGAVPPDATKQTHGPMRELFKQCVLAVQYGMAAESMACRIGQPPIVARDLLRAHRETYRVFWRWSDAVVDYAMLAGSLHTVFGWHVHVHESPNPRSLRNFPMQANGAEMLRLACCLATERGVEVCSPVHDAVLICAPLERLEADIERMQAAMTEASRIVLCGFQLRTDVMRVHQPDRFRDPRGTEMWDKVIGLINKRHQVTVEVAA